MYAAKFKHKVIQDLVWVMESPILLNSYYIPSIEQDLSTIIDNTFCDQLLNSSKQWLQALDIDPAPVYRFLSKNNSKRLGHYFELLVEYWIVKRIKPKFFISHLQVFDNKRTLGEFDFLYSINNDSTLIHMEVAVKFYLYFKPRTGAAQYIGPNANDKLEKKFHHLISHQQNLSRSAPGRRAIHQLGFNDVRPSILLKGYLFYPTASIGGLEIPAYVANTHLRGWWTRFGEGEIPCQAVENCWLVLDKQRWLGPLVFDSDATDKLLDNNSLVEYCDTYFRRHQRSLLIVEMEKKQSGKWQEVSRGFVVSPYWPELSP